MEQLLLPVSISEHMVFDSFYPGPNIEIYQSIKTDSQKFLWIAGSKGSGKTHLLQAALHQCFSFSNKGLYIPMHNFKEFNPEILDNLDQLDLICIDDIECILGKRIWEEKLMGLYERLQTAKSQLIVGSFESPKGTHFHLPDLASRFTMFVVHRLELLSESETISAIQLHANTRGFDLPDDCAKYLIRRVQRDVGSLIEIIQILDYESLSKKRKLTIPFIKSILNLGQKSKY